MAQGNIYKIPVEIVEQANKCKRDHACLSDRDFKLCSVDLQHTTERTVIVCEDRSECPYNSPIGGQFVCSCPVRHAIFRKYHV
ncbi:MAG: hypothetical protein KDI63_12610 [Gammaproteobacteria bacterium]|nr:hypothetical protein [Gammaproteobacteria bacterium]